HTVNQPSTVMSDTKKLPEFVAYDSGWCLMPHPGCKTNGLTTYPNCLRALRKMRIHGPSSPQFSGCQELLTVRKTRSGCGIIMVTRPLSVVTAVIPFGEPFGLAG